MFLRNHWYVTAWSADVDRTPTARVVLSEAIALFRTGDDGPVALKTRCPHRTELGAAAA